MLFLFTLFLLEELNELVWIRTVTPGGKDPNSYPGRLLTPANELQPEAMPGRQLVQGPKRMLGRLGSEWNRC